MIWTPLAAAYDADFAALELARSRYIEAQRALLDELRAAWKSALGPAFGLTATLQPWKETSWHSVRGEVLRDGACLGLWAWLGTPWGLPAGTIRLALYVAEAPYADASPHRDEVIRRAVAGLPGPLPGAAYDPVTDVDFDGVPNLVRVDRLMIPAPFDRAAFRAAAIGQARALIEAVGLPVAAAFAPGLVRARELLRAAAAGVEPLLVGEWDVQDLVPWGVKDGVVVGLEDDTRAIYLGLDPIRRALFLDAPAGDPRLKALAGERSSVVHTSPYRPGHEVVWLESVDEALPAPDGLVRILARWLG